MSRTPLVQADIRRFPLRDKSVNLIVTSPPYYGQRRYEGGEAQLGSEPTPEEYLANLWAFMRECWRVLTDDGLAFINLGDKRAGSVAPGTTSGLGAKPQGDRSEMEGSYSKAHFGRRKSRQMLPWRFAIGCIDGEGDPEGIGWIVSEYVWAKPNGMPESVLDRCRDSHEYIFQMAKSERWFTGIDEIREPYAPASAARIAQGFKPTARDAVAANGAMRARGAGEAVDGYEENPLGKLPASVWTIPTESLRIPDAVLKHYDLPEHFAAFPQEIPRRIILGWSPSAVCCACGEGRRPVTSKLPHDPKAFASVQQESGRGWHGGDPAKRSLGVAASDRETTVTGYACACPTPDAPSRPAVVLDPFLGTGTTLGVARALGRIGIGLDLSFDYLRLARWRIEESGHFAKAVSPYTDRERQRKAVREWAAARRLEWSAGKVCADCGSTPIQAWHPTVAMKSVWTRRASYREPILAEAVALCRRCATARRMGRTTLEWCAATGRWCDGQRATTAVLRAVERLLAA